ncbi:MAG TPA: DEAD/DEAH box helicase [Acidimicrobiales bacterium]|nr:DEAD/DEAH box helicase [Acidimicrobiales bacterium]
MTFLDYRQEFIDGLGFGLDSFQLDAIEAVDKRVNVLVSAPTGSGKTLIANYAIGRELNREQRTFYTTPLKALSNQKYHELCERYGSEQVGLLTGDTSINRSAPVVVMTTEVLRNMLLTDSDQLMTLGLVVLDEVHYLQDPYRGGVWEEVLILTPAPVRFVALSATIGNADFLGEWLSEVRGPTTVIVERTRPIVLHNHIAVVRRGQPGAEIHDLLDGSRLSNDARRIDGLMKSTRKFRPGPKWHGPKSSAPPPPFRAPRRSELMHALEAEDLLPVIVFIFSRAACDDAVHQLRRDGLLFTTPEERREIERTAQDRLADFSSEDLVALEYADFVDALRRGIAGHHAGMVPAFREIVETCFEQNLLSVVFATETLALGINMPARSVALERFTKYSDAGRQFLTSAEYAQMTGRAGRRGLDDEGHAIVCFASDLSLQDVGRIALAPPANLHSSFRPTYNFTANLINHFDYDTALQVVQRSFAQFESDRRPAGTKRPLAQMMIARRNVLEELGYAQGWTLSESGQLLRSLYHECDLLLAESLNAGVFEGLEPAELAGLLSCFVYESKRLARSERAGHHVTAKKKRVHHDRLGQIRRMSIAERFLEITTIDATIREVEERYQVPHFKEPDAHFSTIIAAWARGVSLGTVLDLADAEIGQTSPGDFVRNAKQVADLCEQLGRLRHLTEVADVALDARDAVLRSVVAGASSVHPSD